jgi:hypothetical protein
MLLMIAGCAAEPIRPVDVPTTSDGLAVDASLVDASVSNEASARVSAYEDPGSAELGKCIAAAHRTPDIKEALTKCVPLQPEKPPTDASFDGPVNGWLSPAFIQDTIRLRFGMFRVCYEEGLHRNPRLQGRVAVKFVIDLDGKIRTAMDGGSDLPDPDVVACCVEHFKQVQFPNPEGGIVTVVYPIIFNPGD